MSMNGLEFRVFASIGRTNLVGMRQDAIFAGMLKIAHRLLLVIVAFALVGATSIQLAQSARFAASDASAGMPCDMMMQMDAVAGQTMADEGQGTPMAPCKGMTPDCIKQMGCITDVGFPARLTVAGFSVTSIQVSYWHSRPAMMGLANTPEPMPPRTI